MGDFRPKFHNLDNIFQQNIIPQFFNGQKLKGGSCQWMAKMRV